MKRFFYLITFAFWLEVLEDLLFLFRYGGVGGRNREQRREIRASIKRLEALQRQGIYVTGATNRLRARGSPMSLTVSQGGVTAGSPAVVGAGVTALCGVVESAKDANNVAVVHFEGVWSLTFTSVGAVAVGDPIYIIPGTAVLTQTAASNKLFANAVSALAGTTTGLVQMRLAGSN